ncbi:MAG: UDP-N-acetylmuramate-L-alanine ligase, UDP-N-acetylmuramate-alanine ligase [Candidatus Peregrinibacteria bacterium GW2011_GWF2_38_29]|nr:MAG: UDP-N-acetylmuramate-L-alanine ligase, UDP-N-acetylmuramate-alanine ligase [Candidatus Peregrinibacteria bacterium GW2011_GWF2_38_29]HBB02955.1 hypothetical protein [Candidatus Peregrinibacteria bacterium]
MKNAHFIGIGGIGMSALAMMAKSRNLNISGSDEVASEITNTLKKRGIKISIGHSSKNVPKKCDLVIYSLAAPESNPERVEAKRRKIKQSSYPQALGEFTKSNQNICVTGTHGKSTTSGMLSKILIDCKIDPLVIIGTKTRYLKYGNFHNGKSKFSVLEACEYRRAFLNLKQYIGIITNVDSDHLDYYKNSDNYLKAFKEFAAKTPKNGFLIINKDDKRSVLAAKSCKGNVIYVSEKNAPKLNLTLPGEHNRMNALLAITAARILGCPIQKAVKSVNEYEGSWRRFEYKGKLGTSMVFDDYAHHPNEIKATLAGAREKFPNKYILCVFQPHQYARTKSFINEFPKAFLNADEVIVPNIYDVIGREEKVKPITPDQFVAKLKTAHKNVKNSNGFENTVTLIKKNIKKYQVIIVMGAGDVYKITEKLFKFSSK